MSLAEETEAGPDDYRERLLDLAESNGGEIARAFAGAYVRRLSTDGSISPEHLWAEIHGVLKFADTRGHKPVAVRAFNPTLADDGYEPLGSVLETNSDDWPFLVDSVSAALEARGEHVARLVHPIIGIARENGAISSVSHARNAAHRESVMHFDLTRRLTAHELEELQTDVETVLHAVRSTVTDFGAMTQRVESMISLARKASTRYDSDEIREAVDFLAWLLRGNFVLLGAREYEITGDAYRCVPGSGLGILADEERSAYSTPVPLSELPEALRVLATSGELLIVDKANARSPVHRHERMDYVGVRRITPDGEIAGEARLLGLFTSKAYTEPASETPVLHRKLRRVLEAEDLIEGSHDYKSAVSLFDTFPKDELFAAPVDDLRRAVVALLALEGTDRVRLLGRRARDGRSAAFILALPRDRYRALLVERVTRLFKRRFKTKDVEAQHMLGEGGSRVRVHFLVHAPDGLPEIANAELEREVVQLARTWDDALSAALAERFGPARGRLLRSIWAAHLPEHYKGYTSPQVGALDIALLEQLSEQGPFLVSLQPLAAHTRIALYKRGPKVELGEALPMLEDLGLRVIEEISTRLTGEDETWVQEFRVLGPDGSPLDLDAVGNRVAELLAAVHRGAAETDNLNRLVITAGLDRRQVAILRAYRKYRQRVGTRFTESYQNDVLVANSALTAKLVRFFELRFDPELETDEEAEAALREEILADLEEVASLDHDRILRNQLTVIEATLRTNAYNSDREALAFKIRSADVPAVPQPAPYREIYVYSPDVEGIHLRGGPIARGGLRWSDRQDYRTEVFGLMRAQLTKNAVIVPAGAKGGFYIKRGDDVERHYVTFIRSLLSVTDNLVDGMVVPPPAVRVRDGDDTYLVVAADKGTATFSDTANRVSREYGFWLDDAFASGGSAGYDHKALGITAKGAWESVKRHFKELGVDTQRDEFTVVGIGDMSGDVFGNGMLLSDRIRLVAAYDHRHVFIDPSPDAARGFEERKRLFETPRSSWDDYARELISEGGGVYPRTAKSITLSPQAREALGVEEERLAPTDVIRAILRAPVDLLWNGGIGTVVKASTETDADAADRSSDAIRVNADELRAKVVGEGGNLGFTRRARVEYASAGGRINADFIDNSAGVDCSDHEVNLKILLGLAERAGELTREERDELLFQVTDDVVAHVLYDSFQQAQIIAQEVDRSASRLFAYEDLMVQLEEFGMLSRAAEDLPGSEEIGERRRAGRGMERPELATLLAYSKRLLARALEESDFVDEPWLERDLRAYFPAPVVKRFGHLIAEHPLRTQLICMVNANAIVNALGPTFMSQLVAERGAVPADVVRAFRIAREVTGADARWEVVERLDAGSRDAQLELMGSIDSLVEATTRWYLTWEPEGEIAATIAAGRDGFERLAAALGELGSEERRRRREQTVERLVGAGVPEPLAQAHALRPELRYAPDMVWVAGATGQPIERVAEVFFDVGAELRLDWIEGELDRIPAPTRMQRWALQAVREDAAQMRRELAGAVLAESDGDVDAYLQERGAALRRFTSFLRSLTREGEPDLAGLTLAVRQLRALAG
ncbi:NAD-glutamate dehydrogenase [Solirubrobacter sp. CPCC 204708]|uniref:NAD-glutamate dehydrogenase n=1 Tax=Solirubrobacter deserti TaxID=2282478 RepID=A0ABT4RH35_9ACTN|nr:NAD-glutamate dehydrogenase [Solirubrobacter deserti]MBE2319626.1 NAD-glutamate dehydrogenase [Solirubrobacter deserti]MDA0137635.1 NAD-glutamate dehydrogenase [Solirubrobacter deserti]